jgi:hypothetical protein
MSTIRARPVPVLVGLILALFGGVLFLSFKAYAGTPPHDPGFTVSSTPVVTDAHFVIPKFTHGTWTLSVHSHGQIIGSAQGTSGMLTVTVPAPTTCGYQADVTQVGPKGIVRFYSGSHAHASCCASSTTTDAFTTSVRES